MDALHAYRDELRAAYERITVLEAERVECPRCARRARVWRVVVNVFTLVAIVFGSAAAMIVLWVVLVVASMGGMGIGVGVAV